MTPFLRDISSKKVARSTLRILFALVLAISLSQVAASAQSSGAKKSNGLKKISNAFNLFGDRKVNKGGIFDDISVTDISTEKNSAKPGSDFAAPEPETPETKEARVRAERVKKMKFRDATKSDAVLDPTANAQVRLEKDAPSSIIGMVGSMRDGDMGTAAQYADQFVKMQKNYFFEVRQMTSLIGEALVRQKVINEEQWVGVGQHMDIELARTRKEMGVLMKPDHDTAMERIKPDSKGQVEILYFFTMNCSWCRKMAPNVERLWRLSKKDPNIKMTALHIGNVNEKWIEEYRSYTGLTAPILNGAEAAKSLKVGFVPALVVVGKTENRAYLKTGQQDFSRMYQFVKKVQGLPAEITPEIKKLVHQPIGEVELKASGVLIAKTDKSAVRARLARAKRAERYKAERF